MNKEKHWYTIENIDQIDTPALVVYPQRVKENIRILKSMIDDPERLRPHVKTHKTIEATRLMMAAGIYKFKCATIAEAEMLGMAKAADVVLAYPLVGRKLDRLFSLIEHYPDTVFSCLVDNSVSARQLSDKAIGQNLIVNAFIDLNVGMNRTGIKPGDKAIQLYKECTVLEGIKIRGFHAYDGHIREVELNERAEHFRRSFSPVEAMVSELRKMGFTELKLIMGGSPTFPFYAKLADIECSPGTFIFWDKGYHDTLPEQHFLSAALLITRIISLPDDTKICLDMGYKSIASENDLQHRTYFLSHPDIKIVGQSEEHLMLEASKGHTWKVGDIFYCEPIHICPTCALYESAVTVKDGMATDSWQIIARDRKITI